MSNYEATIVNKKGETVVVELVQQTGKPIEIVNIKGKPIVQVPETTKVATTEVTVTQKTGNKVVVTTDQQFIKTDSTIRVVNQNIIAKLPELVSYVPVKSDSTTYGNTKETTIVYAVEGKKSIEVTTIVDTATNKVQIINSQEVV